MDDSLKRSWAVNLPRLGIIHARSACTLPAVHIPIVRYQRIKVVRPCADERTFSIRVQFSIHGWTLCIRSRIVPLEWSCSELCTSTSRHIEWTLQCFLIYIRTEQWYFLIRTVKCILKIIEKFYTYQNELFQWCTY